VLDRSSENKRCLKVETQQPSGVSEALQRQVSHTLDGGGVRPCVCGHGPQDQKYHGQSPAELIIYPGEGVQAKGGFKPALELIDQLTELL
jgi:hypothetical protein